MTTEQSQKNRTATCLLTGPLQILSSIIQGVKVQRAQRPPSAAPAASQLMQHAPVKAQASLRSCVSMSQAAPQIFLASHWALGLMLSPGSVQMISLPRYAVQTNHLPSTEAPSVTLTPTRLNPNLPQATRRQRVLQ